MKNKKSKLNESLNEIFDIDSNDFESEIIPAEITNIQEDTSSDNDIKDDYEFSRQNLYSLIKKGQAAIDGILDIAEESEMPRAYEVAGQLIKNVSDATDKLLDLQKKLKDIEEVGKSKGPTNVTNALFVGSTAELSKLLNSQLKDDL
jgi:predicted DNA-binding protein YlxM (UPF0122 family)